MIPFRRNYIASLVMLGFFSILAVSMSLSEEGVGIIPGIGFSILAAVPMIPVVRKGGICEHLKLAFGISIGLAVIFGGIVCLGFTEFAVAGGGEGPKGEGSPMAVIVAMAFFALFFFCPWLLTALRGFAAIRQNSQD